MSDSKHQEYVMGIDEAGRGPVLGPMLYGACLCPVSKLEDLKSLGFKDSKELSDKVRHQYFRDIQQSPYLEWIVDAIPADWMSSQMLAKNRYSLNEISHDSAIQMISYALHAGYNIKHVFLDTVGIPQAYEEKLNNYFTGYNLKFTVESGADASYAVVSAASICAKVTRDDIINHWTFDEKYEKNICIEYQSPINMDAMKEKCNETKVKEIHCNDGNDGNNENIESNVDVIDTDGNMMKVLGSGYPGDPCTKQWLRKNVDFVFGFPRIVRFSWSPAQRIIDNSCAQVEWSDDIAENSLGRLGFGAVRKEKAVKRSTYFESKNLKLCDNYPF